jgi:hypothetical protein
MNTSASICKPAINEINEHLKQALEAHKTDNISKALEHTLVVIGAQAHLIKHLISVVDSKADAEE